MTPPNPLQAIIDRAKKLRTFVYGERSVSKGAIGEYFSEHGVQLADDLERLARAHEACVDGLNRECRCGSLECHACLVLNEAEKILKGES